MDPTIQLDQRAEVAVVFKKDDRLHKYIHYVAISKTKGGWHEYDK